MKFEIYQQKGGLLLDGQWRWRLLAVNGEPIASGESYVNKQDCIHAINLVMSTTRQTVFNEVAS